MLPYSRNTLLKSAKPEGRGPKKSLVVDVQLVMSGWWFFFVTIQPKLVAVVS